MIRGEKVTLRARRPSDAEHAKRWYADPETTRWLIDVGTYDVPSEPMTFADVRLTIDDTGTGTPIGTAGLTGASPEHRHATLFVVIGDGAYRGRGYGTDVVRTLCRFAFDDMNLAKVELEVVAGHEVALHIYEGLGFHREVHRRRAPWIDGAWRDEYLMGLLAGELR